MSPGTGAVQHAGAKVYMDEVFSTGSGLAQRVQVPNIKDSGPKSHQGYGIWSQGPQILAS